MKIKSALIILLISQLYSCQKDDCDRTSLNPLTGVYEYPIVPGTEEWAKLKTNDEKLSVLQIPVCILDIISDSGLVKTCLNYPRYLDFTAFGNPVIGFDRMVNQFNGYQMILGDKRYYHYIVNYYCKKNAMKLDTNWTSLEYINYHGPIFAQELLLSKQNIIENISENDRITLFKRALSNLYSKMNNDDFNPFSYNNCAFLLTRLMNYYKYPSFLNEVEADPELQNYLITASPFYLDIFDKILSLAIEFNSEIENYSH